MGSGAVGRQPRRAAGLRRSVAPAGGQAVVEFALASLVLLMLFFGTLDLGRAVFTHALLTNAVREAARTGSIAPGDLTGLRTAAANRSPGLGLTPTSTIITATCYQWNGTAWEIIPAGCGGAQSGNRLVVTANYPFDLTAPRLLGLSTIVMSERAQVSIQ